MISTSDARQKALCIAHVCDSHFCALSPLLWFHMVSGCYLTSLLSTTAPWQCVKRTGFSFSIPIGLGCACVYDHKYDTIMCYQWAINLSFFLHLIFSLFYTIIPPGSRVSFNISYFLPSFEHALTNTEPYIFLLEPIEKAISGI